MQDWQGSKWGACDRSHLPPGPDSHISFLPILGQKSVCLLLLSLPCVHGPRKMERGKERTILPSMCRAPRRNSLLMPCGPSSLEASCTSLLIWRQKTLQNIAKQSHFGAKKCLKPHQFPYVGMINFQLTSQQRLFTFKVEFSISEGVPANKVFTTWRDHSD